MSQWHFQKDGKEVGPISANQLVELAGRGGLQLETQVRRSDMTESMPAKEVKELKAAIASHTPDRASDPDEESESSTDGAFESASTDSEKSDTAKSTATQSDSESQGGISLTENIANRVTNLAGVEKLEGFSLMELFSEVLKKHKAEEVEEYFTVGAPSTTPDISQVDTTWPRPWVFFRTFAITILVFASFHQMWAIYGNTNVLPGLIMTGSFVVPIAALIFFVEINVRRNVSLYQVVRLLFSGGVLAMSLSLFVYMLAAYLPTQWLGLSVAGLIEEPGKLIALVLVVYNTKYRYTLNGLLFGAAVGTGFAAFESAGYAFNELFINGQQAMTDTIITRGMLAPFAHIAWTAMCGAAIWKVKGDQKFKLGMLLDWGFVRIFIIAVGLHMVWNFPIPLPFYTKFLGLGAVAWIIVLAFVQDGLKQLRAEKVTAHEQAANANNTTEG
jgi:protease PrsW